MGHINTHKHSYVYWGLNHASEKFFSIRPITKSVWKKRMKVICVGGIRPDWINLSVVFDQLQRNKIENIVVHTGQHYSYNLDKIFFEELGIRKPDAFLEVGSGTQGEQIARTIERSEGVMVKEKPDLLISFSDGNPALSALAATKLHIKVAHLEAGMRSNDWRMPEEKNRRVIDHISDYLFPPTTVARGNLVKEGVNPHKIFEVSKIIIDVLVRFRTQIDESSILEKLDLHPNEYFLVTLHRPENIDDSRILGNLLKGLEMIQKRFGMKIIAPLHPRTTTNIHEFGFKYPENSEIMSPLGFFDFSKLEKEAFCIVTDSGTVQEDACYFRVPCVTARISTERPETLEVGANMLADTLQPDHILSCTEQMVKTKRKWKIPYREGSAEKIVGILEEKEEEIVKPKIWWD